MINPKMPEDYLVRLKRSKEELIKLANNLNISSDSVKGEALQIAIQLLEKEIKGVEYLRLF
jgi:hypothetical protein